MQTRLGGEETLLKRFRYQIAIFLSVVGPGLITANVDNDSGGILTYSQAGAQIRLPAAVDPDPHHAAADRHAGDVLAHGRGHRQRVSPT